MTIDPARIARYLGLAEKAMHPPWSAAKHNINSARFYGKTKNLSFKPCDVYFGNERGFRVGDADTCWNDGDFIAAIHEGANMVRELAAELEAVRKDANRMRKLCDEMDRNITGYDGMPIWTAMCNAVGTSGGGGDFMRAVIDSAKGG